MAFRSHVLVCAGTGCVSCGSFQIGSALEREIQTVFAKRDRVAAYPHFFSFFFVMSKTTLSAFSPSETLSIASAGSIP